MYFLAQQLIKKYHRSCLHNAKVTISLPFIRYWGWGVGYSYIVTCLKSIKSIKYILVCIILSVILSVSLLKKASSLCLIFCDMLIIKLAVFNARKNCHPTISLSSSKINSCPGFTVCAPFANLLTGKLLNHCPPIGQQPTFASEPISDNSLEQKKVYLSFTNWTTTYVYTE